MGDAQGGQPVRRRDLRADTPASQLASCLSIRESRPYNARTVIVMGQAFLKAMGITRFEGPDPVGAVSTGRIRPYDMRRPAWRRQCSPVVRRTPVQPGLPAAPCVGRPQIAPAALLCLRDKMTLCWQTRNRERKRSLPATSQGRFAPANRSLVPRTTTSRGTRFVESEAKLKTSVHARGHVVVANVRQ